jgi:2-oxoglutarate ferredoxin oxidoreductase subunit beta
VHNEKDSTLAFILANMIHNPELPRPMGVFLSVDRPTYEMQLQDQIARARSRGPADLQALLDGDETWIIE